MPAKSKAQQRLFGMVHAYQQGKLKRAPKNIKEIAAHISSEDAEHFAKTRRSSLPDKATDASEKQASWEQTLNRLFLEGVLSRLREL